MLECIYRDGLDEFSHNFEITKYFPQNYNLQFRLHETVSVPYLSTRGKIVDMNGLFENNTYVVKLLNGIKINVDRREIQPFDVRKIDLPMNANFSFITDKHYRTMID